MRVSVFFDHILQAKEQTGKPLEELLAGVRSSGIEAVEICLTYLVEHPETVQLLKDADLKVSCIYEFYEMGLREEEEKANRHIETAVKVGASRVLVVPGFLHGLEAKRMQGKMKQGGLMQGKLKSTNMEQCNALEKWFEKNRKIGKMVEGLSYIAQLGARKGVTVTVEDFDDMNSPLSGMYGIHWFLKKVPELRYTLDTGNYLFYGEDVLDAWELLKDKVAHVHCKDRHPQSNASVQTGSGRMPIKQLVLALAEQGYDGYLAIEHFDVLGQEECMRNSAQYLQGLGVER